MEHWTTRASPSLDPVFPSQGVPAPTGLQFKTIPWKSRRAAVTMSRRARRFVNAAPHRTILRPPTRRSSIEGMVSRPVNGESVAWGCGRGLPLWESMTAMKPTANTSPIAGIATSLFHRAERSPRFRFLTGHCCQLRVAFRPRPTPMAHPIEVITPAGWRALSIPEAGKQRLEVARRRTDAPRRWQFARKATLRSQL